MIGAPRLPCVIARQPHVPLRACSSGRASIRTCCGATTHAGTDALQAVDDDRSPGFSPLVTTRRPSTTGPSVTSRYSALLSASTTMTNFLLWSVPTARSFTASAGSDFGWPICSRANWPGIRLPSALSNTARTRTVPLRASTWLSISCMRPSTSAPVDGGHAHRDAPDIAHAELGRAAQRTRHHLLVGIEARVDRVDRDQRGQHRRARAGGDQVADRDLELADAAGDRRTNFACSRD